MQIPAPEITLEIDGALARISLNRANKRNALKLSMWQAIPGLIAQAEAAASVRLVVITGAGGHFSAGADIAELPAAYATKEQALANQGVMLDAMAAVERCALPTLAVIDGVCVGGGCGLALACDMRWATPQAVFAITPAKLGLAYGIADTRRLVQAVGLSRARHILFTGSKADATSALAWGLIDEIASTADLEEAVSMLAATLAGSARYSIKASKQMIARVAAGAIDDDDLSKAVFGAAFDGNDFKEGFAAFTEKRPPRFQ